MPRRFSLDIMCCLKSYRFCIVCVFLLLIKHLQKDISEQWALACGEILRVLTHYNRPISKAECCRSVGTSTDISGCEASSSNAPQTHQDLERKTLTRLLTPWITDCLLAAPLGVKSDYFRW